MTTFLLLSKTVLMTILYVDMTLSSDTFETGTCPIIRNGDQTIETSEDFEFDISKTVAVRCWVANIDTCAKGVLATEFSVFKKLGYNIFNISRPIENQNWDVIWSFQYPWPSNVLPQSKADQVIFDIVANMKPNQKINHFPGETAFTHKKTLCSTGLKHIPKTFYVPKQKEEFIKYNQDGMHQYWVQKHPMHRHVKVVEYEDVKYDHIMLYQEFISNPLLLDGYVFDIGVYVVLTSVNPLRVYLYDHEWRIKVSRTKYHPFDLNDQMKYILPGVTELQFMKDLPGLNKFYKSGMISDKEVLFMYLKEQGYNTDSVEETMKTAIREMLLLTEEDIIKSIQEHSDSTRHYFGLYRTDFIITQDMEVKLIETNMSPYIGMLDSEQKAESLVYSTLRLVGLDNVALPMDLSFNDEDIQALSSDLATFNQECVKARCVDTCDPDICSLCWPCMSNSDKADLKAAYIEHTYRNGFSRVFPQPIKSQVAAVEKKNMKDLNRKNQWMSEWFRGKCLQSKTWCT